MVNTITNISPRVHSREPKRTEAWSKDGDVEVGGKFLHVCGEHALAGYDVAGQADTNHLQDSFEDEHSEMR